MRAHEAAQEFDDAFVTAARAIYRTNDTRALQKARINERLGSPLFDFKFHAPAARRGAP